MQHRPRRLRKSTSIRNLAQEHRLDIRDLVMPLFVIEGEGIRQPIPSMPGIERLSIDQLLKECAELWQLGIQAVALFPVIANELKDPQGRVALDEEGLYPRAIKMLKKALPEMTVITDVALDPYSSDGHDGLLSPKGEILNDATLEILAAIALCQARAGADMVAPSDMMDGRVGFIRSALDKEGYSQVGIIAYTAKYASSFYAPFREALGSVPRSGDKKSYQMNPANIREALWEASLDIRQGADILLVKPGLAYLDVLQTIRRKSPVPVAVYNVSGEYAMLKNAAESFADWDYQSCVLEILLAFKRAGADMIFSYHAKEAAAWLQAV